MVKHHQQCYETIQITIDVKKSEIAEFIKSNNLVQLNNKWKNETEARSLASMIALRKAMKVLPIKNAVSFHSSIEKAERNKDLQSYITNSYDFVPIDSYTVSSKIATTKRNDIVKEFANSNRALITNAKCLTEGVDVPNIDCIVFADPRKSKVDIVQALGRALRKKKGKEWGYVILPVLYDDETHEIDNDNYNEIISIVRGLAANDERIIEYFKDKSEKIETKRIEGSKVFDFNFSADLLDEKELTAQLQIKIWGSLSKFNWMEFEKAREFIHSLNLKNGKEWSDYCKFGNKPHNIPTGASKTYQDSGWISWGDWLGTGSPSPLGRKYLSYNEAQKIVKNLGLKNNNEWRIWSKSERPLLIPGKPDIIYKDKWLGWGHWLGTDNISNHKKLFMTYYEAQEFVSKLNLKSNSEWRVYSKSENFNTQLPTAPNRNYENEWVNWEHFLGKDKLNYLSFEEQKSIVQKFNFQSGVEFKKHIDSNIIKGVHRQPNEVFKGNGWKGWQDFLGYVEHPRKSIFVSYEECKQFALNQNIKSARKW